MERLGPEGYCDTVGFRLVLGHIEEPGPDPSVRFFTHVDFEALAVLAAAISETVEPVSPRPGLRSAVRLGRRIGATVAAGFRVQSFRVDERIEITALGGLGDLPELPDEQIGPPVEWTRSSNGSWAIGWPEPNVRAPLT